MRRVIVGLLALAIWGSLAIGPARADQRTYPDRAGDVGHGMDIRRVTVANNHRLVVTIKHREVSELAGGWSGIYIDITPHRSSTPDYYLAGSVGGDYQLYWMQTWNQIGGKLGCPGGRYTQSFDSRTDVTRFSLARACLNGATFRATRVRVAAVAGINTGRQDWAPGFHRYGTWVPLN